MTTKTSRSTSLTANTVTYHYLMWYWMNAVLPFAFGWILLTVASLWNTKMRDQPKKTRLLFSESTVGKTHFFFKAAAREGIKVGSVSGCFLSYIWFKTFGDCLNRGDASKLLIAGRLTAWNRGSCIETSLSLLLHSKLVKLFQPVLSVIFLSAIANYQILQQNEIKSNYNQAKAQKIALK